MRHIKSGVLASSHCFRACERSRYNNSAGKVTATWVSGRRGGMEERGRGGARGGEGEGWGL